MSVDKKESSLPLVEIGIERFVNQLIEFCVCHGKYHEDQVFIMRNILINTTANILRNSSDSPENFIEKFDLILRDLEKTKDIFANNFHQVGFRSSMIDGKQTH